eukprot:gene19501-22169_t
MSGNPQYEEDVFVEDDLEEDEYLYQVAINFGDPKSEAIESLEYEDDSEEESKPGSTKKKASLPHNPRSEGFDAEKINEAVDGQTSVVPESIFEYAKTISTIDWGSIVQIKHGTAGETPTADKFPYFGKTHKHWLHLLWDADPSEWVLVMLNSKLEESEENLDELPPTRKIYIRDISEVFLELAPSTSFRIYLSAETSDTPEIPSNTAIIPHSASEEEALEAGVVHEEGSDITTPSTNTQTTRYGSVTVPSVPTVLRITPEPTVRWHAAMWVDALYAAMQLQIHEPQDEVFDIRTQYYETVPAHDPTQVEDGEGGVSADGIDLGASVDEARHSEIAYSDIYGPNGQANKDNTVTQPSSKSCCVIC